MMHIKELAALRLINQQLINPVCTSVEQVVNWMGAMQAQDYGMAKWAIGVRLPGSTDALIEQAIDRAEIIRTHLLRPTWHFVAATDIYWMLELTAPHVMKSVAFMHRKLELDDATFGKSNTIIENALTNHTYLTREELMLRLQVAGIPTNELRSAHLMYHAELTGLVCNGPRRGNQITYALLSERVPVRNSLPREAALAELAKRYFSSHGPATLRDFVWWSGLTVKDARTAIDMSKVHLVSVSIDSTVYWLTEPVLAISPLPESIHLLPAFDEFLISYCDREASISPDMASQAFTKNGIFKPIIVVDGQVVGIWKRTIKPKSISVDLTFFYPLPASLIEHIREHVSLYASYMPPKPIIIR